MINRNEPTIYRGRNVALSLKTTPMYRAPMGTPISFTNRDIINISDVNEIVILR